MDCVFCGIVTGDVEASIVHRDQHVIAFLDLHPLSTGHLLVVPRAHADSLAELDPEDGSRLFRVAHRLVGAVRRSAVRSDGVNLFLADGEAAGQEVSHVHLHVLPRHAGDGFRLDVTAGAPTRSELDATADEIRAAL